MQFSESLFYMRHYSIFVNVRMSNLFFSLSFAFMDVMIIVLKIKSIHVDFPYRKHNCFD